MMFDDKILRKIEVVKLAEEIGVTKAANLFNISRKSIYNWQKIYRESGVEGFAPPKRNTQLHPNRMSDQDYKKIGELLTSNENLTIEKINRELSKKYSTSTIHKKIGEIKRRVTHKSLEGRGVLLRVRKILDSRGECQYVIIGVDLKNGSEYITISDYLSDLTIYNSIVHIYRAISRVGDEDLTFYIKNRNFIKSRSLLGGKESGFVVKHSETLSGSFPDSKSLKEIKGRVRLGVELSLTEIHSIFLNSNKHLFKKYPYLLQFIPIKPDQLVQYEDERSYLNSKTYFIDLFICVRERVKKFNKEFKYTQTIELLQGLEILYLKMKVDIKINNLIYLLLADTALFIEDNRLSKTYLDKVDLSYFRSKDSEKVISFYDLIGKYYLKSGKFGKSKRLYQNLYRRINSAEVYNITMLRLGTIEKKQGKITKSTSIFERVLDRLDIGDSIWYEVVANLIHNYQIEDCMDKAIELAERLSLDKLGDDIVNLPLIYNLGVLYSNQKRYDLGLRYFEKGLAITKKSSGISNSIHFLVSLGYLNNLMGNYRRSLELLLEAKDYVKDRVGKSSIYQNLAKVYLNLNKLDLSLEYVEKGLRLKRDKKINYLESLHTKCMVLKGLGDKENLRNCVDEGIRRCVKLKYDELKERFESFL